MDVIDIEIVYRYVGMWFCFSAIALSIVAVSVLIVNYIWCHLCDVAAFMRVVREAKRQGITLWKRDYHDR
jgi:hypothetical protein